jgi:hypothetical protein
MRRKLSTHTYLSADTLGWVATAVSLVVAVILGLGSPQRNWHAAIVWTMTAFYGALLLGRSKWTVWQFWMLWATFFALHVLAMWVIFARLIPHWTPGTLLAIPLGFAEAVLILVLIAKFSRLLFGKF